jgi:hypothetical protein
VGPRAGLHAMQKKTSLSLHPGIESRPSNPYPVTTSTELSRLPVHALYQNFKYLLLYIPITQLEIQIYVTVILPVVLYFVSRIMGRT